jgi:2-dehydro-3-deoxygluconokinase
VGDASLVQNLSHGGSYVHDGVVRGGEDSIAAAYQCGGGGDGFVSGLLYGILKGWKAEDCLHFGWATGAMAVTMLEDYASPVDEAQVWNVWKGNARVAR